MIKDRCHSRRFAQTALLGTGLLLLSMMAGGWMHPATKGSRSSAQVSCELHEPTVLQQQGNTVLQAWELAFAPIWSAEMLPRTPGYSAYRAAIRAADADELRPTADALKRTTDEERKIARREDLNNALMYTGGGEIRPIRCLEAALFAWQDARYSQLTRPTEFIAHILRKDKRLKVFFGASDQMFPPKDVYGFAQVTNEVAAGWEYWVVLHNHTLNTVDGKLSLGVPAPSTSDVPLFKGLVERLGLREVWVTNGMYTGVISAENLGQFHGRE
jgi:hypothetical protein